MKNQNWTFLVLPQFQKDLQKSKISKQKIIKKLQISEKKTPYKKGNKLKGNLKGIRAVRVGNHRVVFESIGEIYLLGAIGNRDEIYNKAARRKKSLQKSSNLLEKLNLKSF
ncbi:MAG: type II toxin-antitoxin system RelE family toxin [bacterium]